MTRFLLRRRSLLTQKGFTLLEVLVAMSILVVLGTALMLILRGGLRTWRQSEAKREAYDRGQSVLLQLRDDFANLLAPSESPLPGLGETESRLMCERDQEGRTRLFLVRSLKAEAELGRAKDESGALGGPELIESRQRILTLEAENSDLRRRVEAARQKVAILVERMAFLERETVDEAS